QQRQLRLAGGGRGAASWSGRGGAQGVYMRWSKIQLELVRDAPGGTGVHRHLRLRASARVPLWGGAGRGGQGQRRSMEAVRTLDAAGVGGAGERTAYGAASGLRPAGRSARELLG